MVKTEPIDRDRTIWPDVLGGTKMGDGRQIFVEAQTNNNDAGMHIYIYWHIPPEDADNHEPVLVIEMDDEVLGDEGGDINVRIRRNDGLIFEGTKDSTTYIEEG